MSDWSMYTPLDIESLKMHKAGRPGKIEVVPTKPLTTQYHLSLAYSPGVAAPVPRRSPNDPATRLRLHRPRATWSR